MATTATVDYSRAERPLLTSRQHVEYLEQFVRMRKPGPARAAADAAGGGPSPGRYGIATVAIARPPDAHAPPRRPVARYHPGRSWAGETRPWSSSSSQREGSAWTTATATATETMTTSRAKKTPPGSFSSSLPNSASALSGAGAVLPPLLPAAVQAAAASQRRPNSAPLPLGGMLLFDGALTTTTTTMATTAMMTTTPRRAKHRPTTTPDQESGSAARALLRREPPAPTTGGEPVGSWACWPATLRALPLRGGVIHDSITRHRYSDPWDRPPQRAATACADRLLSPCTTARPDPAAAREAYAGALEGYLANKRRATLGAPAARRYARPFAPVPPSSFFGGASAPPLLPPRIRAPTGAARPASPDGSRWAAKAAATAPTRGGSSTDSGGGEFAVF